MLGRGLMGVLGSCLVVIPLLTTTGVRLVAASPAILLGVFLVVLCAFQPRIDGPLRYRGFDIPIGPPRASRDARGGMDVRQDAVVADSEVVRPPSGVSTDVTDATQAG